MNENSGAPLLERGRAVIAEREREDRERVAENVARGRADVRRSFVFRFYHDTMLDTHLSGYYHKLGPDSPDPDIRPVAMPHGLGGGYHGVPWEFDYDGIRWRAEYRYGYESWGLDFYVFGRPERPTRQWARRPFVRNTIRRALRRREWRIVHAPWQVVEALR